MDEITATGNDLTRGPLQRRDLNDALLALALLVFVWLAMYLPDAVFVAGGRMPHGFNEFDRQNLTPTIAYVLAALCLLPVALRRRYPRTTLAMVTVAVVVFQLLPAFVHVRMTPSLVIVGMMVALYSAGAHLPRGTFLAWALPCALIVLLAGMPAWGGLGFWSQVIATGALLAVAGAFGDATRNRRAYLAEAIRRAEAAERSRDEEAARRVDEERIRIARELHDITAHSLSIVVVQSGVALHVLDADREAARASLQAIRETSRTSLTELRGMLGVLRASGESPDLPLAPTPGLARLDDLVQPLREAGLPVEVVAPDASRPLPQMVDASAYRIIQEALTNVLRHARDARVRVGVTRDEDTLHIDVTNTGAVAAASAPVEGHGIAGMRERASSLGGTFEAGPLESGGWHVTATLPLTVRST